METFVASYAMMRKYIEAFIKSNSSVLHDNKTRPWEQSQAYEQGWSDCLNELSERLDDFKDIAIITTQGETKWSMNWNKKYYSKVLQYRRKHPEKVSEWNRRYYQKRRKSKTNGTTHKPTQP